MRALRRETLIGFVVRMGMDARAAPDRAGLDGHREEWPLLADREDRLVALWTSAEMSNPPTKLRHRMDQDLE